MSPEETDWAEELESLERPAAGGQPPSDGMPSEIEGRDVQFWYDSYHILRDAIINDLAVFVPDGEEAEEHLLSVAIRDAAAFIASIRSAVTAQRGVSGVPPTEEP